MLDFDSQKEALFTKGFFLFLALLTVSYISTSVTSREFVEVFRFIFLILSVLLIFCFFLQYTKIYRSFIVFSSLYFFTIVWGFFLAIAVDNDFFEVGIRIKDFIITCVGFLYVLYFYEVGEKETLAKYFVVYSFLCILLTIVTGGMALDYPPHFIFEYESSLLEGGGEWLYSQGMSRFFGISVIFSSYLFFYAKKGRVLFLFLTLLFIVLSFLGGARGESVLAFFVMLIFLITNLKAVHLASLACAISALVLAVDWSKLEDFIIFQRLSVIIHGDSLGERDILWAQLFSLLKEDYYCFFMGCGFEYFQYKYNYGFGMSPHNMVLEMFLTYGFLLASIFIFFVLVGLRRYIKKNGVDYFVLLFVYLFLLGSKSGYLFGDWLLMSLCLFFVAFGRRMENRSFCI